jgi:beta-glucosidase
LFQDGGGSVANLSGKIPNQNLHDPVVAAARASNLAVVFVSNAGSEGGDLSNIDLSGEQNQLVSDDAAANPNTVVVVNSGSAVTMPWADSVKACRELVPRPGGRQRHRGTPLRDSNFSGKLPVIFPKSLNDVPARTPQQRPGQNGSVQYSEGLNVGYRWYDSQHIAPLYPFGYGLSYTTYGYQNLTVSTPDSVSTVNVGFDVTNTGSRAGTEVAQVYVAQPAGVGEPPKSLRASA